jgi:hypothetical protein
MLETIMQWLISRLNGRPTVYLGLDLETTGLSLDSFIVAIGHCTVVDGQALSYDHRVLNWVDYPGVDQQRLEASLESCRFNMGDRFHGIDMDRMQQVGEDPVLVLSDYLQLIERTKAAGLRFAGHNVLQFDKPRMEYAFNTWLNLPFRFSEIAFIDTAAWEMGRKAGILPQAHEDLDAYFLRVMQTRRKGVYFKLDSDCVREYGLDKSFELDLTQSHKDPGFDCLLSHLLLQAMLERTDCAKQPAYAAGSQDKGQKPDIQAATSAVN